MGHADPGKRVRQAIQALRHVADPMSRLAAVRDARQRLEDLERETAMAARESGVTWEHLGEVYGMTKQGAQQRFGATRSRGADQRFHTSEATSSHSAR